MCIITNHPARYRDPTTGLPFYNVQAYREIQCLRKGEHRWSKILGAWAGSGAQAAKGVPARFLNPDAPAPAKPQPPQQQQQPEAKETKETKDKGSNGATTGNNTNSDTNNTGNENKEHVAPTDQPSNSGLMQDSGVKDTPEAIENPPNVKV